MLELRKLHYADRLAGRIQETVAYLSAMSPSQLERLLTSQLNDLHSRAGGPRQDADLLGCVLCDTELDVSRPILKVELVERHRKGTILDKYALLPDMSTPRETDSGAVTVVILQY